MDRAADGRQPRRVRVAVGRDLGHKVKVWRPVGKGFGIDGGERGLDTLALWLHVEGFRAEGPDVEDDALGNVRETVLAMA